MDLKRTPKSDKSGNSKTVFSMLGASNHSKEEREYNDWYATPPFVLKNFYKKNNLIIIY